jgi:HEAT repeat protein
LLEDSQSTVVAAAARALGAGGGLEDPGPLVALLTRPDKQVRLEAATSLARLGATEGIAALERLAADPDADLRRSTATAIGQLAEPVFVPTLFTLLEDRHDIARAALDSLTATVGKDVSAPRGDDESPPTVAERIRRWQRWYQESQEAVESR